MAAPISLRSDLELLAVGISATGLLCLTLADLLPLWVFLVLAVVHLVVYRRLYRVAVLPVTLAAGVAVAVMGLEALRVLLLGREELLLALRDTIVMLALIRLLMKKALREVFQIIGIALGECIMSTVFTTSPTFLIGIALLTVQVPMALYALDGLAFGEDPAQVRRTGLRWAQVLVGIVIISLMLFFLLPRPSSTILKQGLVHRTRTGFSEEVQLARSSRISEDRRVLMRILWVSGEAPPRFYLAGARLEELAPNGFHKRDAERVTFQEQGAFSDRLTIYPTGITTRNVFFPFRAVAFAPGRVQCEGGTCYWSEEPPPVYDVWVARDLGKESLPVLPLPDALAEVGAYGREIAGHAPVSLQVQRLIRHLRSGYAATLEGLAIPPGVNPIHWFVFTGKRGNCEHFASALAVMLRGSGIPARVVTGFAVNEYNTSGAYFLVRARDAHAWVEYFDGVWHTLDATAQSGLTPRRGPGLLDALRFKWIRWVIQYSLDDQIHLALYMNVHTPQISRYVLVAGAALLVPGTLVAGVVLLARRRRRPEYARVVRAFAHRGLRLGDGDDHEEHLRQVQEQWPQMAPPFEAYLDHYLPWRFGQTPVSMRSETEDLLKRIRDASPPETP